MGGFNWKDILLPAAAGALVNNSAPTGAAAGAVLGLLNANTGLLPQNTAGDLLTAAIQGYAQNKFQGAPGGAGARRIRVRICIRVRFRARRRAPGRFPGARPARASAAGPLFPVPAVLRAAPARVHG